jgi:Flp pilus assembly pilin Flp
MQALTRSWRKAIRSFHEDEEGMETIQVVMLVAIAALVLIALKAFWNDIKQWVGKVLKKTTQDEEW